MPLTLIRNNQLQGLLEASNHALVAGFIINFRNTDNETLFISIDNFLRMIEKISKKSFNIKDLLENNAVKIESTKKRTRYFYNIQKMLNELNNEVKNGN